MQMGRMSLGELILKRFSRDPGAEDCSQNRSGNPLALLTREFGDLRARLNHKRIVDFGCGDGRQAIALATELNSFVCGIDTNERTLSCARKLAQVEQLTEDRIEFRNRITEEMSETYDVVISQNSMEHFENPEAVLGEMKRLIRENGEIWITFGPPWLAPYGAHMHFFCRMPWMNIFFSEKTVLKVRSQYRQDGAKRYEEVESGLNKMTVARFERIASSSGLRISHIRYNCVKGMDWLGKIRIVREFFINNITCVLRKADGYEPASGTEGH